MSRSPLKYIDDYRDGDTARQLVRQIHLSVDPARRYHLMEFCGGHTHAIFRYGLQDLLPPAVQLIHGPGCPVCVLPAGRIDAAIALAQNPDVVLCCYGDLLRVPGAQRNSLLKARGQGADVRIVYSTLDALALARRLPDRQIVFFAIGFETTTPPTAQAIRQAASEDVGNFSVFCNHVLTPPAMQAILEAPPDETGQTVSLDGFLGPAHVSTIIGSQAYARFAHDYHRPVVIAGFEPLDVLQAVLMLIRQINDGRHQIENEYSRAVTSDGNRKAQALMDEIFMLRPQFEWRGLGMIANSALQLRPAYARFDAECRFSVPDIPAADVKACACGSILRGLKRPTDCRLFGTACRPDHPLGACMVSAEGACAAYYSYGRLRDGAGGAEPS